MPPHLHPLPGGERKLIRIPLSRWERVRVRAKSSSIQHRLSSNTHAANLVLPLASALLLSFFWACCSFVPLIEAQEMPGHQHGAPPAATGSPEASLAPTAPVLQPEKSAEAPAVKITPEKQQLIGVKTVEATLKPLERTIRTVGRIEYDERKIATVNTKFEGWIEKLYVDYTGREVKKGEPLAEIYSPELMATQLEFINLLNWRKAKAEGAFATMLEKDVQAMVEAGRQRLRLWDIAESQIRTIEETGRPIRTLTLYSPVNGSVVQKMAVLGMRAMPGEKLFDIADLSTVWVIADIYEYVLRMVTVGDRADITLSYSPGQVFSTVVDFVYPALSPDTRTAKVRFSIPNPTRQLKPQMYTNVEVKIDLGTRLAIPANAVIDTGARKIVYVDNGQGAFEPREVVSGLKGDDWIEVVMGLQAGERVATSANFLIDSEAKLRGAEAPQHRH
jgi:membrane fusion protein, copper/silver efflux system